MVTKGLSSAKHYKIENIEQKKYAIAAKFFFKIPFFVIKHVFVVGNFYGR